MKRGAIVAIAAGAVAIVLGGGALAWWLSTRPPSLEDAAKSYLQALVDGDADAVAAMLTESSRADLTPQLAAFGAAAEYVTEYTIIETGVMDDVIGGVRADVSLGGDETTVLVGFQVIDDRWVLDHEFLSDLTVTMSLGDTVRIGDALFPVAEYIGLFPAVYDIAPAPAPLLAGGSTVAVSTADPITVEIDATLAPEATVAAQEQIDAYAASCTQPAADVPENCGIRIPWAADFATVTSIAYRIDSAPVVTIAPDARTFAATGGVLVATATGTTRDGAAASFTYRADDWALRGSIAFAGDEMVLSVD